MELLVSVEMSAELALQLSDGGGSGTDVAVEFDSAHTVADLAAALAAFFGIAQGVSVEGQGVFLPAAMLLAEAPILTGDNLYLEATDLASTLPDRARRPTRELDHRPTVGRWMLAVASGVDVGTSVALKRCADSGGEQQTEFGNFGDLAGEIRPLRSTDDRLSTKALHGQVIRVGRSASCDLVLSDPQVSREQLHCVVGPDGELLVVPVGSSLNGVRFNGEPLTEPRVFGPGDVVRVGSSSIAVRPVTVISKPSGGQSGQVPFFRAPHFPTPVLAAKFGSIGKLPQAPEGRSFAVAQAVLPIVVGLLMVYLFRNWRFGLFMLMSPLSLVGNYFESKRGSKKRYRLGVERFRRNLGQRQEDLESAISDERVKRFRNAPDLADLIERVRLRSVELWLRDRSTPEFLNVRLGIGDVGATIEVEPENDGDEELLVEAEESLSFAETLADVPVQLNLAEVGVLALVGQRHDSSLLAGSLLVQAGCLHSPEDLVLAAVADPRGQLGEWFKWLPHSRAAKSPLSGSHFATTSVEGDGLLRELVLLAEERIGGSGGTELSARRWPWMLLVLDGSLEMDSSLVSQLLDLCPQAGISVVWQAADAGRVPRQAQAVVYCEPLASGRMSRVAFTDPTVKDQLLDIERIKPCESSKVSKALAPLRDASTVNAAGAIPKTVPLYTALGVSDVSVSWVAQQWATDRGHSLSAPFAFTESGPLDVDLVADGPHGLIAGTSGSGKSELLQSMVASMMVRNSPDVLNFMFVDYKGGAASSLFADSPHTVGCVTNLDSQLAVRALKSLTAELNRRMRLLDGRAKDLAEMVQRFPDDAPPSLVIVVDEFATLVSEIPEFVDGIVDIAQRGRSLGIHLLLATQRPSGAINDNILANTNLRFGLRMLDSSESQKVIGSDVAASVPGPLKGRGFARLGAGNLVAFQSAWSSAPLVKADGHCPVLVSRFEASGAETAAVSAAPSGKVSSAGLTQVEGVVNAVAAAAQLTDRSSERSVWKEPLPRFVPLDKVRSDPRSERSLEQPGRFVNVGLVDDPDAQDQYPALLDLEAGGGVGCVRHGRFGQNESA